MVDGLKLCLFLILNFFVQILQANRNFNVIWNVPSKICLIKYGIDLPLAKYGIHVNKNQSYSGDIISIFYEPTPGLYPRYLLNGTAQNGGLPQIVNITDHLIKEKSDIFKRIPDTYFKGFAVIDWESWVPIFDRNEYDSNKKIYITSSKLLVKKNNPDWNVTHIENVARKQFQLNARKLMQDTLRFARSLRPHGQWGFYGFPKCYNNRIGQRNCSEDTMKYNNELCWMFSASTSLFPSIYIKESFGDIDARRIKVEGIIQEAQRIKSVCSRQTLPVMAYSRYRFPDTENFYTKEDLLNTIQQSYQKGLDGVILWDTYDNFLNESDCLTLKEYITRTLGPVVQKVAF